MFICLRYVKVTLEQYNLDEDGTINYLDDGEKGIFILYSIFSAFYAVFGIIWIRLCFKQQRSDLRPVHHSITVLLLLKIVCLVLGAIQLSYVAKNGVLENAWTYIHQISIILLSVLLYVVVVLIGSGWSVSKASFNTREKAIIAVVLILQLLIQTGIAILEVFSRGAFMFPLIEVVLRVSDFVCCILVLLPVMWSIRNLERSSDISDKAESNLIRLKTFRDLYFVFISFLYCRIVILSMLKLTIECPDSWISTTVDEIIFFFFFVFVGKKLRPMKDNPYLNAGLWKGDHSVPLAFLGNSIGRLFHDGSDEDNMKQPLKKEGRDFLSFAPMPTPVPPAKDTVGEVLTASAANSFASLAR